MRDRVGHRFDGRQTIIRQNLDKDPVIRPASALLAVDGFEVALWDLVERSPDLAAGSRYDVRYTRRRPDRPPGECKTMFRQAGQPEVAVTGAHCLHDRWQHVAPVGEVVGVSHWQEGGREVNGAADGDDRQDPSETDKFIFEQTQRTLDRQATVLSELRQRTSIILSATGIIASLLGAAALKDGHPRGLLYAALLATALGIGLCLRALRTVNDKENDLKREWKVTLSAEELRQLERGEKNLAGLTAELAPWRTTNYRTIDARTKLFWRASVVLPVQIWLWSWVVLF